MIIARPCQSGQFAYSAIDDNTYDGAEDSSNRNMIGYGRTPDEAIADFMKLMEEMANEYLQSYKAG